MNYLSLFSGIEAASVAWEPLGWSATGFSEIEPFPCRLLKSRFPHAPNYGDVTAFKRWPELSVDLLVGGSPCQSFSVAGLRKGLADPRGNLMLTFGAIARRYRPRWLVWENVPGVLSSGGGRDFGTFLGMLAELGYGFAYRVLDAQHIGVPQRRRRVFVVGHLGDWRRAAAVLFERHSLQGHSPPRREAGKDVAPCLGAGPVSGGRTYGTCADSAESLVARPLLGKANCSHAEDKKAYIASTGDIAHCLNAGGMGRIDYETETLLSFDTTQITSLANRSNPKQGDPCHPLAAGAHAPAIAFRASGQEGFAPGTVSPPIVATDGGGAGVPTVFQTRVARNGRGAPEEVGPALNGSDAGETSDMRPVLHHGPAVRRLTPLEAERLQGFPDGWTAIPGAKDGPRYRALGNSMAVPVMAWIGKRIQMVEEL